MNKLVFRKRKTIDAIDPKTKKQMQDFIKRKHHNNALLSFVSE